MKNFKREGCTFEFIAQADVASGDGVMVGKLFGVSNFSVKAGEKGVASREGVYNLPKTNAQAWTQGDVLYWDGSKVTTSSNSGGYTKIGYADADAANPSASGDVMIHQ